MLPRSIFVLTVNIKYGIKNIVVCSIKQVFIYVIKYFFMLHKQ